MRVLGRIRLSRLTEESTSAARQREIIQGWADSNGHEVIGWAEDLDVSGSVDPFDTPALGPWLTRERMGDWDVLCAWKLDRIGRRAIPLNKVFGWMMDNEKTLVCVSDSIDLSTWVGRLVANVIAGVAEGELESIRERTKASRKKLLESGRWPGGTLPYGWQTQEIGGGGWKLVLHQGQAKVILRMVDEILAGSAVEAVANRLNGDGVLTPVPGKPWLPSTLWKILESKRLLGHALYDGQTVRDHKGLPVLNAEPLLSSDEFSRLQAALQTRKVGPQRTRQTSPLLGVVVCYVCQQPLFHRFYKRKYGKELYRYYHCRVRAHTSHVDAEMVEELLGQRFLEAVGCVKRKDKVFIPAEDHTLELEEAVRAVDELTSLLGTITSTTMRSRLTGQLSALDGRISALEGMESRPAGWEYVETDETYAEAWNAADTEGRRQLLLQSEITAEVKRTAGTQEFQFKLNVPDDILTLLNEKNPPTRR